MILLKIKILWMLGYISNYSRIVGSRKGDGNIKEGIEASREIINNGRIVIKVTVALWIIRGNDEILSNRTPALSEVAKENKNFPKFKFTVGNHRQSCDIHQENMIS